MDNHIYWGLAAISSVIMSWLLYRYLLPRSWREWTRAGILQAFIIAFYAEMYGFPLTIYLLTRVLKLDAKGTSLWDGNLWIYVTGSPAAMLVSMIVGYAIAIFGIVLLAASWRELYRATKEKRLATEGPLRLRASSAIYRSLSCCVRRRRRALADGFLPCSFCGDRFCLCDAGAERGAGHVEQIRT